MSTIDRLEKVTMELAQQLKVITDTTTSMKTNVSQNISHIKDISQDVAGLRKEIVKQHKDAQHNSKELKDIRKEVIHLKDMGKDLSGLQKELEKRQKDSQLCSRELKEIKKEVSQVKEIGKDVAGMRKEVEKFHEDI